jgi:LPXTG-motif cell wall-anchored protein
VNLLGAGEPATASITPQAASSPPAPTTTVASEPPAPIVTIPPPTTVLPGAPAPTLPPTGGGADNGNMAIVGALMLGAGIGLLQLSRRRSTS